LRPLSTPPLRSGGGGGAGQAAKDATGADIKSKEWLKTHLPGDHTLSQGLKVRARDERPERRETARGRCARPKRRADRAFRPFPGAFASRAPLASRG
jgi:hypothetical protein